VFTGRRPSLSGRSRLAAAVVALVAVSAAVSFTLFRPQDGVEIPPTRP
jgi:hypothetical protein